MPTNIAPATTAVFTDATLDTAAALAADAYRPVWTGPSGEESSSETVARHLEATIALLNQEGWVRTYAQNTQKPTDEDLVDDDSMTIKQMVRALLRIVRAEIGDPLQPTLPLALNRIGVDGIHGDMDTVHVSLRVLDLIIRAHTGSDSASATLWAERQHHTHADVTALLTAAASFARTYGPAARAAA